ncbi:MAG: MBL fold metallo-hydrolase [Candidatus Cloacimonetes bacterium]|nr:MBL fold metallo-hydrolase [Candidatus Cloacimonadota bacterium]
MIDVRWFGHSMWRISHQGVTIVTDPFTDIGYPMPTGLAADIVLVSHDHYDHHNTALVHGDPTVVREAGQYEFCGVAIDMAPCWHDEEQGAQRGPNLLMRFDVGGRRFVHCGDLGHMPDDETLARLGEVDVLMVPVGGFYTIDAGTAGKLVEKLKPKIVFPMHYKTAVLDFPIDTVEPFARHASNVRVVENNHVILAPADFEQTQTILLGFK